MPHRLAEPRDGLPGNQGPTGRLALVGIGASAGGLEAASKLMEGVPPDCGLAFILIQHLDPSRESMMVELLTRHTAMTVLQATDNLPIQPDHLYVIPPGNDLSVGNGVLHLSKPPMRQGARTAFDFLLTSMAECYGDRAACVVLSGTGMDGSAGLLAIRAKGGLVFAQDPTEAGYSGMPISAIETGEVNFVLPVAKIAAALVEFLIAPATAPNAAAAMIAPSDAVDEPWLPKIIDLLRAETVHDFTLYKPGTLQRRVERRMALAAIKPNAVGDYLDLLRGNRRELDLLAKDLLINVTSFFRDAKVFDTLANTFIPGLVESHPPDRPLRIWVAGCSTGEETYSLAMLFIEQIEAQRRTIKLQVFASDIDADAVAVARTGLYPDTIGSSVSPDRLARFFSQEGAEWRATPELRAVIVFTVQDVLADPPFSRLDFFSCRNLLIYLQPDAQASVIGRFYFGLREGGILLLGSAETIAEPNGRFEIASKPDRIYRRLARTRVTTPPLPAPSPDRPRDEMRVRTAPLPARPLARPAALAELGRRLVIETYAPAAILINTANETLFSMGPTERYLRLPPGHATHDLLAMARPGLRAKLRTTIQSAREAKATIVASGRTTSDGQGRPFNLEVHPVLEAGEEMLLVCFVETPQLQRQPRGVLPAKQLPRVAELERELEAMRTELQGTVRDLELSGEEQRAINEEALSVNEEYQSTNEELVVSKEELQSLNEELTAVNSQLQETLERQRTTSDDLQNVLYSTNVATLFLDLELRIRFFTPAIRSLFAIIPDDVGRKLSDFAAMAPDAELDADVRTVLTRLEPVEQEIETKDGVWFRRRVLPYRAHNNRVEGVVITFTDITMRKSVGNALEVAKKLAETANAGKSRFLAAASHDLRQPLQTLLLLQGLLAKTVQGERAKSLVSRLDDTLGAMGGMLDTLLDINEIEAGVVRADVSAFPINDLLDRLRDEFDYHAQAKGLTLHVVSCHLQVLSDPRLLEQMVRNLISNALKYTSKGRVLLGCRRRGTTLNVEVLDTGIGIPASELNTIFEEYRQIGNAARERSQGLGLGLSIVKRLSVLLEHRITVRSNPGRGSSFAVAVPLSPSQLQLATIQTAAAPVAEVNGPKGTILVVEDDPDLQELLGELLRNEGHGVTTAADGPASLIALAYCKPDLLLVDYNLPNGPNGLQLASEIRRRAGQDIPVVVLTGDISSETMSAAARHGYTQLNKPVKRGELMQVISRALMASLPKGHPGPVAPSGSGRPTVFVVDDDDSVRAAIVEMLEDDGQAVAGFPNSEAFLQAYRPGGEACLLVDAYLPGLDGIGLLEHLRASDHHLPAIMITGQSDVQMAVRAMKAGASDFIEKPVSRGDLLASVGRALEQSRDSTKRTAWQAEAAAQVAALTPRQRQIMMLVLAGHPSKNIAADLGISQRTVENHRASIMHKTASASLPALARLALAADPGNADLGQFPEASPSL